MKEVPNNLRSRQFAKVVDLLSEGPIRGVVNGMMGVVLDGVQLQANSGAMTYPNTVVQFVNGYPTQAIMSGFASQEAEETVGLIMRTNQPLIRGIANLDADRVRVTVSVPQLTNLNTKSGDIDGSHVEYDILLAPYGGGYQSQGGFSINGKTNSRYQRAHELRLPGIGPWQIQVVRTSTDQHGADITNDIYWDSYTMIIDDRINYAHSACVGLTFDAEQFSSIPKRTYLTDGLLIRIPTNYDPYAATYNGVWDGTFKQDWCNCPPWVFYDLIINNRYGLGSFITPSMVDKWALYKIAQFCDQRIPNGKGGFERRYTCNVQIMDQLEAFDLLAEIAQIFRGFAYWAGGKMVAGADMPVDPVLQFSNANVIDGRFTYAGADIRARHTMASVGWQDPANLGEGRIAVTEDRDQISRFGINSADVTVMGCTSETQANRTGKWTLYTEQFESESVTFTAGLETAWGRPGDICRIADRNIAGQRMGGRVIGYWNNDPHYITVDQRPPMAGGVTYDLSCIIPVDKNTTIVQSRTALVTNLLNTIYINPPFSAQPVADSIFVLNDPGDIEPTLWRTIQITQNDNDKYEIQALRHFPQKWDYVERNIEFSTPRVSAIVSKPAPPKNLVVKEYMVQTSPISVGVRCVISWTGTAPSHEVFYRQPPGNYAHVRTDGSAYDLPIEEGDWEFLVQPISSIGIRGDPATIKVNIIGRFALPQPPTNFKVNVQEGVALFSWDPATELDVIIGGYFQMRHSSAETYADWNSSQIKVPSVPGKASTCETSYQPGTYLLRTFDITGRGSATWAMILTHTEDDRYVQWARLCEHPTWLGEHDNTELKLPQEWLTIKNVDSGYVDDQLTMIDDWLEIDTLPVVEGVPARNNGIYNFENSFDAGAVFPVRFAADMLAFGYSEDAFIDARMTDSDTWVNWDDVSADYSGLVSIQIRVASDNPGVQWSEWQTFVAGEYIARWFQFRAILTAPPGQNVGVETLCITGDFKAKADSGNDVPYSAAITRVYFGIKFFYVPAVVITLQLAMAEDRIEVVTKTREYFEIRITMTSSGTNPVGARSFDWHAQGY
jgi:predicted phage tail protein